MTSYHAFDEIHNETAAAIIETGFLNLDRQILTQHPDMVARGIADGVLCYIYNESITTQPTPLPTPTSGP
jgi:N-acetylmuramoyl-L-alanine amidase